MWSKLGISLKEPSTWVGIIALLGTAGVHIAPEYKDYIVQFGVALGADTVIAYEENVATQIEQQIFPPIVTPPLPWNNSQASEAS